MLPMVTVAKWDAQNAGPRKLNSRHWAHLLLGLRKVRFVMPNVRANRPAEAGGVSLARDSGEAAARQAYAACRSGSG